MDVIGVDLGNCNIKTSTGLIIPSKVIKGESIFNSEYELNFEGEHFVIGEGDFDTNLDKTSKEYLLPMLCAALALSTKEQFVRVVLGLPLNQYKAKKNSLIELLENNKVLKFSINDVQREIIITEAAIYPEGVATYYSLNSNVRSDLKDRDLIILDIGGRTTDVALLTGGKRSISKSTSLDVGMINIYNNLINEINSLFTLNLNLEDAEGIIKRGLEIDGVKQDISFLKDIIKNNVDKIFKELNVNYPTRTCPILVTGGGGESLFKSIKKRYPSAILVENYLFSNAQGFRKVGEKLWQD